MGPIAAPTAVEATSKLAPTKKPTHELLQKSENPSIPKDKTTEPKSDKNSAKKIKSYYTNMHPGSHH
jgi:hypothetical protein